MLVVTVFLQNLPDFSAGVPLDKDNADDWFLHVKGPPSITGLNKLFVITEFKPNKLFIFL